MSHRELNCEEVIERLFDWLDRRLDHTHSAEIQRHMKRCRECFSRAEFERHLRERIARAGATRAPDSLRRRVRSLLDGF